MFLELLRDLKQIEITWTKCDIVVSGELQQKLKTKRKIENNLTKN